MITFRKAKPEEYPRIIAMQTEVFCGEQDIPEELIGTFLEQNPNCWCAEQDGIIIGSVASWEENGEIHVGRFIVAPEYRGQKIGTRLMAYAFQELFDGGAETLFFEARDSAAAIIRSMGGQCTGEAFAFFRGNVTPMVLKKKSFQTIITDIRL